jgi:hypothetical protein
VAFSLEQREGRVLVAALGQLWAAWAALARNDALAARAVFTVFQHNWPDVRPTLIASFDNPATRASVEAITPVTLARTTGTWDGIWGTNTKAAALPVLAAVLGGAVYSAVQASCPTSQRAVGAWWTSNLAGRFPASSADEIIGILWSFDREVRGSRSDQWALDVQARTMEVINDVSLGQPIITAGTQSTQSIIEATSSTDATGAQGAVTSGSFTTGDDAAAHEAAAQTHDDTTLSDMLVVGRRPQWSGWLYLAVGLGVVTFGGVAWWLSRRARLHKTHAVAGLGRRKRRGKNRRAA